MATQRNRKSSRYVVKSSRPLKQDRKSNRHSSGGLFGKGLIVFVCSMIIGYLIVDIICGFKIGQFLPDVLTTAWFSFWAVELVNLVVIKRSKIRAQFPDLIEAVPESTNSINVNLRPKEDFGNFNENVQNAANANSLENPLPVQDDIQFEPVTDDYTAYVEANDEGGNSGCLNLIY